MSRNRYYSYTRLLAYVSMTLSKVYFFMIIIICLALSLAITLFTEDLKEHKRYKRYLKFTALIGVLGIIMELLGWNHLCRFQCVLLTFTPFLTLIISKATMELYRKVFKREPFQMHNGKLSDGFYVENKGNLKFKRYYGFYTGSIIGFPFMIIMILFVIIQENVC